MIIDHHGGAVIMGALSRREFLNSCGLTGVAAALGAAFLSTGCTKDEAGSGGTYTVTVVSGAVLGEVDSKTGTYDYYDYCSLCRWTSKTSHTVKGKSVSTSFICPQCKFKQEVVINASKS